MRVAIASGKGGTGKTLVATNLSRFLVERGERVAYVDTDVEAPNGHLFLKPEVASRLPATVPVPALKGERCAGHGRCQEVCAFNAILAAKGSILVFNELCHGCAACVLACPDQALAERRREIGVIEQGDAGGIRFVAGILNVGEARGTPLVSEVLRRATRDSGSGFMMIDAPPGTSCMAVEAVKDADLVLLVTEPTPFGCHDLKLAVQMCRALGVRPAAIINRADLGDASVYRLLAEAGVPVIAEIPFEREIAAAYAAGEMAIDRSPRFREQLAAIEEYIDKQPSGAS